MPQHKKLTSKQVTLDAFCMSCVFFLLRLSVVFAYIFCDLACSGDVFACLLCVLFHVRFEVVLDVCCYSFNMYVSYFMHRFSLFPYCQHQGLAVEQKAPYTLRMAVWVSIWDQNYGSRFLPNAVCHDLGRGGFGERRSDVGHPPRSVAGCPGNEILQQVASQRLVKMSCH